jgi:hypothetical protein
MARDNRPKRIIKPKLVEMGELSQVYPSWLRFCCRSRIQATETEVLEAWRQHNRTILEKSPHQWRFIKNILIF